MMYATSCECIGYMLGRERPAGALDLVPGVARWLAPSSGPPVGQPPAHLHDVLETAVQRADPEPGLADKARRAGVLS